MAVDTLRTVAANNEGYQAYLNTSFPEWPAKGLTEMQPGHQPHLS